MLRKLIAAAYLALLGWLPLYPVRAQQAQIVVSCGTQSMGVAIPGTSGLYINAQGQLCVNATVNATVGGFQPNGAYSTLTATAASSASTALPTGATVRITNLGATAIVSCTFATGAATGLVSNLTIPPLSSVSRVVGTFDHIACIDQTGSTGSNLVVLEGGSGLGNDSGGGGGGSGGGGAITAASGSYASGALASGSMVDLGSQADSACGTDNGACSAIALIKRGNQNGSTINTSINAAVPPCAAAPCLTTIGNVGIDPSSGASAPVEAFLTLPATTTTQIIALSGTTKTYVTSRLLFSGGNVNVTFKYGTGSNCGTGTTTLDGPWPVIAQAGFSEAGSPVMVVPSGQALCVTTDASVSGGVKLIYQQK